MDGSFDQGLAVPSPILVRELKEIDSLVDQAVRAGDSMVIAARVNQLRLTFQMSGIKLAKILSLWKRNSKAFGVDAADWADEVFAQTGISHQTINKYVNVWDTIFDSDTVPEEFRAALLCKPMQGLLLLPAAIKEGQLDEEDFQDLANSPDPASMREVVRRARGDATSSGTAIRIQLGRDGILTAWQNGVSAPVGYLRPNPEEPMAQAAQERIIRAAGILMD